MKRYEMMFERLRRAGEGAFVPFAVLGDPDAGRSLEVLLALAGAGADALELGIPFSDPVADGPVIQEANRRALAAGSTPAEALAVVGAFRERCPDLPVGLLVYANLVEARGRGRFYAQAAEAGVDSVLVADVPTVEARPYAEAARAHGVAPVLVATANGREADLEVVAGLSGAYTYVVARSGVTGAGEPENERLAGLVRRLGRAGAPPCLLGFGLSTPAHVRGALAAGAAGAICGTAVVERVARAGEDPAARAELPRFVRAMKAATRPAALL